MPLETETGRRSTVVLLWTIKGLLLPVFCFAIGGKLIPLQVMANNFERYGLGDQMTLLGVGELVAFVLFMVPRTNSIGVLLLSAQMGGAIVTHMQHGEMYWLQSAVLALVWTTGIIANPSLLGGLRPKVLPR